MSLPRPRVVLASTASTASTVGIVGLAVLALTGCSSPAGGTSAGATSSPSAGGPIAVNQTDDECRVSTATAPAGTITFQVTNAGSKVNEFYVYAPGDRIVGEVENITPGLSRELTVKIADPGSFQTACKPGLMGDGIRATFTVTGPAQAGSADAKVGVAAGGYGGGALFG